MVMDRLIQQALLQVLQPILDPGFSAHSYGFRPGRSAHQAVLAAQSVVQAGRKIVVDVELEKFFDRVNHDILIDRLRRRIPDPAVIRLVRAYLNSGIMDGGLVSARQEGTPQGAPLWPLLANVMLDEVDKALELQATDTLVDTAFRRSKPATGGGSVTHLPAGLEELLWVGADIRRLAEAGRVDTPSIAVHSAEAVETWQDDLPRAAGAGRSGLAGAESGGQQPAVVAQQRQVAQWRADHQWPWLSVRADTAADHQ